MGEWLWRKEELRGFLGFYIFEIKYLKFKKFKELFIRFGLGLNFLFEEVKL